tara:strand:+ start:1427 stop:4456 length:3030 start_codon:yes stop_codon:yes gene_type:complete
MSKYNNFINNSGLTLNTSEYENGLVLYNTNNDKNISIYLVNDINNNEKEFSINSSNNKLIIKESEKEIIKLEEDKIYLSNDVKIEKSIEIDKYKSDFHNFVTLDNTSVLQINKENTIVKNDIYMEGYLNMSNIHKLPERIVLLDEYGKINPHILPDSTSNLNLLYGEGSNVGIGTHEPNAKLHVYNGDIILEAGYISINPLSNIEKPLCPLHIRNESNRVGSPQIKLTNSKNEDKVILCSEEAFIGIGTSERIRRDDIQLYIESNVLCEGDIRIGSNLKLNENLIEFNGELKGDIKFEGKSTKDAILKFYGNSNMSFGRGEMDKNYRVDILNDTEELLSIGTNNNEKPKILFYRNDEKEKGIELRYEDSNLSINGYNIITEKSIGDIGYLNKIGLNDLYENPLNITIEEDRNIKEIVLYTNNTFILLDNGILYHIYEGIPYKYDIWFNKTIKKIEENNGILFMYVSDDEVYYKSLENRLENGILIYSKNVIYDGIYFIINNGNKMYLKHPNDNENREVNGNYNIRKMINKEGIKLIVTEDNNLYELKRNGEILIYNLITSNVYDVDIGENYIYILKEDNIVYRSSINNKVIQNENINVKENVKEISISKNNVLYILLSEKAELNNQEENLINGLFKEKEIKYIEGKIVSSHIVLLDHSKKIIYTKSFHTSNKLGIGRPLGTIYGSYNNTTLIPVSIQVEEKVLNSKNTITIGKSLEFLRNKDIIDNSLMIEKSIGIRTKPIEKYALTVNGDINVTGRIYTNGVEKDIVDGGEIISGSGGGIIVEDLEGYVKKEEFIEEKEEIREIFYKKEYIDENYMKLSSNEVLINDKVDVRFEELKELELRNRKYVWNIVDETVNNSDYKMLYVNNVSVGINTSNLDIDQEELETNIGQKIIPALHVKRNGIIQGIFTDGEIATYSDRRLKEEIKDLENSLEKVIKLRGRSFIMKDDINKKKIIGLIAQEVEEIIPEIVSEYGDKKTVSYINLIGVLVESIKDLNKKIERIESKINL